MEISTWIPITSVYPSKKVVGIKGKKPKILIVDDQSENCSVIVNMLQPIGFCCFEATNGKDGLHKAEEIQPDLILTDLEMPVMDGFEMMQVLRKIPQLQNVTIIVSSASVFETDKSKSLAAGGNDFLPKPVQIDELLNLLQKYLQLEWIYDESPNSKSKIATADTRGYTQMEPTNIRVHLLQAAVQNPKSLAPPAAELDQLFDLAMRGNINGIQTALDELEKLDKCFLPFVTEVRQLADNFQMKRIREYIKNIKDNSQ